MVRYAFFASGHGWLRHREARGAVGGALPVAATAILWRAGTPARVVVMTTAPALCIALCSFAGVAASLERVLAIPARLFPLPAARKSTHHSSVVALRLGTTHYIVLLARQAAALAMFERGGAGALTSVGGCVWLLARIARGWAQPLSGAASFFGSILSCTGRAPRHSLLRHSKCGLALLVARAPVADAWPLFGTQARVVLGTTMPTAFIARRSFARVAASLERVLSRPAIRFAAPSAINGTL